MSGPGKSGKMLTGWRKTISKLFLIPQRYVVGIMGFLAVVNAYTMRITLSIAITDMTPKKNNRSAMMYDFDDVFNGTIKRHVSSRGVDDDKIYDWDSETQGLILSSFYWGYVITHMPGGMLAERFGGKWVLGLGILSTAVFTLLTPWVVTTGDWPWLLVLRVLEGLGEGTTYPALNCILSKWVPSSERAKLGTLVYAGGQIGTVVGNAASGLIIEATGTWTSVFYIFGGIGMLWFAAFALLCYSDPEVHPYISDEERDFLRKELGEKRKEPLAVPWKAMFTSFPLWALVAAQIGHDWGFFTMVTDLPLFMSDILNFDVMENGIWSSVPYIVMWIVSMSSGALCDWLITKQYMGVTFARKFFTAIAAVGPGIFIVAASYAGNNEALVIALFTVAMGFMGTFYCGMKVNALDLAPNYAGTVMAIVNGIGAITGIITPYLVGLLTPDHSAEQWRIVFWIAFAVFIATTVIYVWGGAAEEQYWNNPDKNFSNSSMPTHNAMAISKSGSKIEGV